MIDIQFVRENPELVKQKSKQKGYDLDIDALLKLDAERKNLQTQVEDIRTRRNEHTDVIKKQGKPTAEQVEQGSKIKAELSQAEQEFSDVHDKWLDLLKAVPNMPLEVVPVGVSEDENVVIRESGEKKEFNFKPKPHWELAYSKDWIDKERAAKISGSRFAYLKGDLVRLQFAIIQLVVKTLSDETVIKQLIDENNLNLSAKPFTPILPPAMLRTEPYEASARLNAAEVTYKLEGDDLWLNASAEHTLCTMYWNEILPEKDLPIRYLGYSTSFRREAGTYGKDTEGIIRLHQFDKLEMEVFSTSETGVDEHKLQIAIQEYLVQQLGIPYRFIQKCTFDIGKPNASGIDIDCWFPGQDRYIETHTADFMTDYQARDLKIRVKRDSGDTELVNTNDATAFAMSRILAAIIENYQTEDGDVLTPEVLKPYM